MACPVCIQCGRCGKEPAFKAAYVKGDRLFCGHRNDAGARTCAKCGAALPLPPGMLGNELPGQCKTPE
jgi:hypothetical protein